LAQAAAAELSKLRLMWSLLVTYAMGLTLSSQDAAELEGNHPVAKVVALLTDMQKQLESEAKEDADVYEKLACWCSTNDREKNAAIIEAEKQITSLTAAIEEYTAKSAQLKAEIAELKAEVERNQQALAQAAKIRKEEADAFAAEEKEMLQTIAALTDAIQVLSKHHEPAADESEEDAKEALIMVRSVLKREHLRHPAHSRVLTLLEQPANYQSYASRSGQIYGILKEMKADFEKNLSQAQKEEQAALQAYGQLVATKKAEIAKAKERIVAKTQLKSDTDVALEQAKWDLKDVRENLSADNKFLMDLKQKCSATDAEYTERQKARQEELAAISEAITILSDDDARDLFSSTFNFAQLQQDSVAHADAKARAIDVLRRAAGKTTSRAAQRQLLALAVQAKLDAFVKVKKAITDMVAQLEQEQKDEVTHRDWCNDELHTVAGDTQAANWKKDDLTTQINNLAQNIEAIDAELETTRAAIAEAKVQLKRAGEDREAANKVFQQSVADQRGTVMVLDKALKRLEKVYAPKAAAAKAFLERQPSKPGEANKPAPEGFKKYQKQQTGGVLELIKQCMDDAKRLERDALAAEQSEQSAYEAFVKDTNEQLAADTRTVAQKVEERAQAQTEKVAAEGDLRLTDEDLERLAKYNGEVHVACDFVLQNFEVRQTARQDEIDALQDAMAILSGAEFQ